MTSQPHFYILGHPTWNIVNVTSIITIHVIYTVNVQYEVQLRGFSSRQSQLYTSDAHITASRLQCKYFCIMGTDEVERGVLISLYTHRISIIPSEYALICCNLIFETWARLLKTPSVTEKTRWCDSASGDDGICHLFGSSDGCIDLNLLGRRRVGGGSILFLGGTFDNSSGSLWQ